MKTNNSNRNEGNNSYNVSWGMVMVYVLGLTILALQVRSIFGVEI